MARSPTVLMPRSPDDPDDETEKPLDPAVERIRLRLRRLILISSATMLVGFAAVLVGVLYKMGPVRDKPALAGGPVDAAIAGALPAGAHVASSSLDGSMLALTVEAEGRTTVLVVDLSTNRVVRRITLAP